MHIRNKGDMNQREVIVSNAELELAHCLYKGRRLDVSDSATKLDKEVDIATRNIAC